MLGDALQVLRAESLGEHSRLSSPSASFLTVTTGREERRWCERACELGEVGMRVWSLSLPMVPMLFVKPRWMESEIVPAGHVD